MTDAAKPDPPSSAAAQTGAASDRTQREDASADDDAQAGGDSTEAGGAQAESDDTDDTDEAAGNRADMDNPVTRVPLWILIPVAGIAALGAVEHAVEPPHAFPANLNTDIVEVSWIVLFLGIVLLNFAEKIGFPGAASVTLRRVRAEQAATEAIDATVDLENARNRVAQLLQGWTNAASLFTGLLEEYGVDEQSVSDITTRFILDRMEEARPIFAPETEKVRLSLWWYSKAIGGLAFVYGTDVVDDVTLNSVFRPCEGLMGQAFVENQMYNLRNAPKSIYFKRHRPRVAYRALLLVPVRDRGARVMAMLSIDRSEKRVFDATAESVGWALSDLVALAYTHPLVTRTMPQYRRND